MPEFSAPALALAHAKGAAAKVPATALPKGLPVTGQLRSHAYGVTMRFKVTINDCDLGHWSSCEGLRVTFGTEKIVSGGDYSHPRNLPVNIQYDPVRLRRAMTGKDSAKVQKWLGKVRDEWVNYDPGKSPYVSQGGHITLFDVTGADVFTWTFAHVYPVSWSGPSLNAQQAGLAIEELVIEHEGFL